MSAFGCFGIQNIFDGGCEVHVQSSPLQAAMMRRDATPVTVLDVAADGGVRGTDHHSVDPTARQGRIHRPVE